MADETLLCANALVSLRGVAYARRQWAYKLTPNFFSSNALDIEFHEATAGTAAAQQKATVSLDAKNETATLTGR